MKEGKYPYYELKKEEEKEVDEVKEDVKKKEEGGKKKEKAQKGSGSGGLAQSIAFLKKREREDFEDFGRPSPKKAKFTHF